MVLFVFQFDPICNFAEFINFGLANARSERVTNFCQGKKLLVTLLFMVHLTADECIFLRTVFNVVTTELWRIGTLSTQLPLQEILRNSQLHSGFHSVSE